MHRHWTLYKQKSDSNKKQLSKVCSAVCALCNNTCNSTCRGITKSRTHTPHYPTSQLIRSFNDITLVELLLVIINSHHQPNRCVCLFTQPNGMFLVSLLISVEIQSDSKELPRLRMSDWKATTATAAAAADVARRTR